jgi:D-alanyl-lipoteichoic acid acyltransferase DltB (MBOAT superfamily)
MVFSSLEYLLVFLPVVLIGFVLLSARARIALGWLVLCSLFFYAWWEPPYLFLLLGSMMFNFVVAGLISRYRQRSGILLAFGVSVNLAAIGWFKYAGFMAGNLNWLFDWSLGGQSIILPLAISFFTFQQIAFLVDCHRDIAHEYDFLDYVLFVSFFPQLIAGPIVHHNDMIPQFRELGRNSFTVDNLQIGLTVLLIGLFKKVVIADGLAEVATPIFERADNGFVLGAAEAWLGAVSYTFQLYFDFSGYTDMAIGAARMFGIRLPENFNSPYKSTSIIDFWRRWHMTLSRFLQEYLYIPLGGNRRGPKRRYVNLMLTMLLGGLWHGAGWTFIFWGGLHGSYLAINHAWASQGGRVRAALMQQAFYRFAAGGLCFLAVVVAWVFFRAETFAGAWNMLQSMGQVAEIPASMPVALSRISLMSLPVLGLAMLVAWLLPNLQEWMAAEQLVLTARKIVPSRLVWSRTWRWGIAAALPASIAMYKMIYMSNSVTEFIYFQF